MLRLVWKERPSVFDEPIASVLTRMNQVTPGSDEFQSLVTQLSELNTSKAQAAKKGASADTKVMVIGNIIVVVIIVAYERSHVLVSRVTNYILKMRK